MVASYTLGSIKNKFRSRFLVLYIVFVLTVFQRVCDSTCWPSLVNRERRGAAADFGDTFVCEESVCSLGQKENSIEGFVTIFFNLLYSKYLLCQTRDFLLGFNLSWVIGEKKRPFLEGKVYFIRESCPFVKPKCISEIIWFLGFVFFCPALFRKE